MHSACAWATGAFSLRVKLIRSSCTTSARADRSTRDRTPRNDRRSHQNPTGEPIVILPEAEFERLRELAEEAEDAAIIARSMADLAAGREELLTTEEVEALLAARTPLAFWRKKRS